MRPPLEQAALKIGTNQVDPPAVLTSMAGIYVCEMITARAVVERHPGTMHMMTFGEHEKPRSMQLYGVDPKTMAEAVRIIVGEGLADHVDSNFGHPMSTQ